MGKSQGFRAKGVRQHHTRSRSGIAVRGSRQVSGANFDARSGSAPGNRICPRAGFASDADTYSWLMLSPSIARLCCLTSDARSSALWASNIIQRGQTSAPGTVRREALCRWELRYFFNVSKPRQIIASFPNFSDVEGES